MGRIEVIGVCALVATLAGCATVPRSSQPPPVLDQRAVVHSHPGQVRANGLRVAIVEGGDTFVAALVFMGGPLNDPPNLPGLGEWMVETALLGSTRRSPSARPPGERALLLGGELVPVANGSVLGWLVSGPPSQAESLLEILGDVAMEPAFPATTMQLLSAQRREALEAEGDEVISLAIAVAVGSAVGLDRPVWLRPSAITLGKVTREDVSRHWRRITRPEAGAMVTQGASARSVAPLLARMDRWRASPLRPVDAPVCRPQGQSTHLVESEGSRPDRTLTLFAAMGPGRGSPGRAATEAMLAHVGEEPAGPLEVALGSEQARRARPDIIDLGRVGTQGVSVLIGGTLGDADSSLQAAGDAARILSMGTAEGADARAAWRVRATRAAMRRSEPLTGSLDEAINLLYGGSHGVDNTSPLDLATTRATPGAWQFSFVVVGVGNLQREAASAVATPTVWLEDGRRQSDAPPVRCLLENNEGG